ncbi:hypothetical protein TRIUR3_10914 [Triticum urartu]|uniref:Uncharacterized protein n=1 Tax=Triticum urartu TaxID=4572 RepID=M8AN00_TRIUA|nr:hypothetical protein TRIUR3_10914 [Triticum urartu]
MIEAGSNMPKDFCIPDQPNIPASSEHHLNKERLVEILFGIDYNFSHVGTLRPINLKAKTFSFKDSKVVAPSRTCRCTIFTKSNLLELAVAQLDLSGSSSSKTAEMRPNPDAARDLRLHQLHFTKAIGPNEEHEGGWTDCKKEKLSSTDNPLRPHGLLPLVLIQIMKVEKSRCLEPA